MDLRHYFRRSIAACEKAAAVLTDTSTIVTEIQEQLRELEVVASLMKKCIEGNT